MTQLKVNESEYIDTEHIKNVMETEYGITIYQAANSNRFFKVFPMGLKSENIEVIELDPNEVYDDIIKYNEYASTINNLIKKFLPSHTPLKEVV